MYRSDSNWLVGLLSLLLVFTYACNDDDDYLSPTDAGKTNQGTPQVVEGKAHSQTPHMLQNFRAHLSGRNVVPPVDNKAQGQATFQVSKDGSEISYKLISANIRNVLMAHIHLGKANENGPVVVWLYPEEDMSPQLISGRFDGVLAEGTITASDLVGPLAGQDLESLIEKIKKDSAYVQTHTQQNPPGATRGQIQ